MLGEMHLISELDFSTPGTSLWPNLQVMFPVLLKAVPTTVTFVSPLIGPCCGWTSKRKGGL
jgi:hypothetical protein